MVRGAGRICSSYRKKRVRALCSLEGSLKSEGIRYQIGGVLVRRRGHGLGRPEFGVGRGKESHRWDSRIKSKGHVVNGLTLGLAIPCLRDAALYFPLPTLKAVVLRRVVVGRPLNLYRARWPVSGQIESNAGAGHTQLSNRGAKQMPSFRERKENARTFKLRPLLQVQMSRRISR